MRATRRWTAASMIAAAFLVAACGGGSSGPGPDSTGIDPLVLVDLSVGGNDGVPLNRILTFEFSEDIDPDSVRPDTLRIRQGPNYGKQVPGYYQVDGNVVKFYPRLPVMPDLSDAGFQPGSAYRVTLPGSPDVATVRSYVNDRLTEETEVDFRTATVGATSLFIDNFLDPLPPQVEFVNPPNGAENVDAESKIRLTFNRRPLHPATVNESNVKLFMQTRLGATVERPVPGKPVITQSHDSVTVEFVPTYPLADQATYRLEVSRRVQDLVGNDIEPFVARFSIGVEPPRFSEVVLEFDEEEKLELMDPAQTTASWNEAEPDAVAALFTVAGGNGTAGDLVPISNRNFRPSDFPRGFEVVVQDGIEYDTYNFREINIPDGITVRFSSGSKNRPVRLLSLKPIRIDGTLTVSGGRGNDGDNSSLDTKITPAAGGTAGPGGGDGADNYTGSKLENAVVMDAPDVALSGSGGEGGGISGYVYYSWSGGGGGGANFTNGKDGSKGGYPSSSTYNGTGGDGGTAAPNRGYPVNYERKPNIGGSGGGAGGVGYYYYYPYRNGGGAGGGGGGALTLQGAGGIHVGSTGRILANGGDGGGTSQYYAYSGGAGGGGGGGSILVRATSTLSFDPLAEIDVSGGKGGPFRGTYTYYQGGEGGDGGAGYVRLEARENENSPGSPLISGQSQSKIVGTTAITTGVFAPKGGGAPSIAQTQWMNLGVFDPSMIRPGVEDIIATTFNDEMRIEVQMAIEDTVTLGQPDLSPQDITDADGDGSYDDTLNPAKLSEWTPITDIETLNGNGYQFLRVRVVFQLDSSQEPDSPLPYLERLAIPFKF